jgi:uncharacterized surface protein with fasciclin (FAS1) repeats
VKRARTIGALALAAALPATAVAAPAPTAARTGGDIVQTAASAGDFTTLTTLLKRAGLAGTLEGRGPFTVFAPTDAAFARVPKATLNALLRDRKALRSVLLYHVASGKVRAAQVVRLSSVKTLNGARVAVRVAGTRVLLNGARVTTPDVTASNGVIHVLNRVLIPPAR